MAEPVEILRADYRCPTCGHRGDSHGTPGSLGCMVRMVYGDLQMTPPPYCPCPNTYRPQPEATP